MTSGQDVPLPQLPPRAADSHKGDFGRALLVGGSRSMSGAIALAGMAALRGGAGLVELAVPDACQSVVASLEPSYMTAGLPSDAGGRIAHRSLAAVLRMAGRADAVACGPGMGRSLGLTHLVGELYTRLPGTLVVDADGLNAISERLELLGKPRGPRILTPHPGEFRRLAKIEDRPTRRQLESRATDLAARLGAVVVLKGQGTLVTDGENSWTNTTGNSGLATGGTGDVLTGLITALAAQGLSAVDAARLGTYLHGLAGDLAADRQGQVSMTARDVVGFLPEAFCRLTAGG